MVRQFGIAVLTMVILDGLWLGLLMTDSCCATTAWVAAVLTRAWGTP